MHASLRAFIAVDFPESLPQVLQTSWQIMRRLEPGIRWVQPQNWHITLKFLGDIPARNCSAIIQAMERTCAGEAPLALQIKGAGVFPNMHRPRVFWLGLQGDVLRLQTLQRRLEQLLHTLNKKRFPLEKRDYAAHLTLGRIKTSTDVRNLTGLLSRFTSLESPLFTINDLVLKHSRLTAQGAEYGDVARVHLNEFAIR